MNLWGAFHIILWPLLSNCEAYNKLELLLTNFYVYTKKIYKKFVKISSRLILLLCVAAWAFENKKNYPQYKKIAKIRSIKICASATSTHKDVRGIVVAGTIWKYRLPSGGAGSLYGIYNIIMNIMCSFRFALSNPLLFNNTFFGYSSTYTRTQECVCVCVWWWQ